MTTDTPRGNSAGASGAEPTTTPACIRARACGPPERGPRSEHHVDVAHELGGEVVAVPEARECEGLADGYDPIEAAAAEAGRERNQRVPGEAEVGERLILARHPGVEGGERGG